jgi:Tfp pilus assembly protein PilF
LTSPYGFIDRWTACCYSKLDEIDPAGEPSEQLMGFKRLVLIVILFGAQAVAQQKPPVPPPTPPPTPPKPQPTPPPNQQPTAPIPPDQQSGLDTIRDVMVTGRLVMPDGMPPPDMVPVGLNCGVNSAANSSTMSDLRGEFRIRLKVPYGPTADRLSRQISTQCSVVLVLPGFETIRKDMGGIDLRAGADVGILVLRPLLKADGTTVSLNGLKAPEPARQELMKAREDIAKDKLSSAQGRLEKAIKIYPEYATAWYELGRLQVRRGEMEKAAESYRQATKTDPKYINPLVELALMAATAQQWPEAEQRSESILKMAPKGMPGVYLVHAIACFNQRKMDTAEQSAREGLSEDKTNQFPKLLNLLGNILLLKGDKAGAADAFRQYLERAPQSPDAARVRAQLEALSK